MINYNCKRKREELIRMKKVYLLNFTGDYGMDYDDIRLHAEAFQSIKALEERAKELLAVNEWFNNNPGDKKTAYKLIDQLTNSTEEYNEAVYYLKENYDILIWEFEVQDMEEMQDEEIDIINIATNEYGEIGIVTKSLKTAKEYIEEIAEEGKNVQDTCYIEQWNVKTECCIQDFIPIETKKIDWEER